MNQFITAADVRTFANVSGTTGRYSDGAIGSNILTAQHFIERETKREFAKSSGTKTYTTEGRAQLAVADFRSVNSIEWDGTALVDGETYWKLPDAKHSGVYTAIQLRVFQREGKWYYSNPEWWDRGLDLPRSGGGSEPNDLVIDAEWGWDPLPYDVLHAVKVLAAWYMKRGDAVLANAVQGPDGAILDYSVLPPEVTDVIRTYRRGDQAVLV